MRYRGIWSGFDGTQKPPAGWALDPLHPLAAGLSLALPCMEGAGPVVDLLQERASAAAATWVDTPGGIAARDWSIASAATADLAFVSGPWSLAVYFWVPAALTSSQFSLTLGRYVYSSEASNSGWRLFLRNDASPGYEFDSFVNNGFASYSLRGGGAPTPGLHGIVHTSDGTTRRLYLDGALIATSTANLNPIATAGTLDNTTSGGAAAPLLQGLGWPGRCLDADEILALNDDPWGMFLPPTTRRRVAIVATPYLPAIIDDGAAGYSQTAGWTFSAEGYGATLRFATTPGDASAVATWMFAGVGNGTYEIDATWVFSGNRATDAPYRIYDGATLLATVRVNQQPEPSGTSYGGRPFQSLGTFTVTGGGPLTVTLAGDANGYVIADAIRVAAATTIPLAGRAPGRSAAYASPGRASALRGSSRGRSAAAAALASAVALAGSATGTATGRGVPARQAAVAGSAVGSSTARATPARTAVVAGTSAGRSTARGALAEAPAVAPGTIALAGRASGRSTSTATLSLQRGTAGTAPGRSGATATPTLQARLAGISGGRASTSARPTRTVALSGLAPGSSPAIGRPSVARALAGTVSGRAVALARLLVARALRGLTTGSSVARGRLAEPVVAAPAVTLRQGLYAHLKADEALVALVGRRIYPDEIPQGVPLPALVYSILSDLVQRNLDGPDGTREARAQVECWARTRSETVAVSRVVDARLEALNDGDGNMGGVTVRWCHRADEQESDVPIADGGDGKRYVLPVDFSINYYSED
jgi:hypothetical protein